MINYLAKGKISHRDFLLIYQAVQFRPYRTFSSEPATRKGDSFSLNISILKYKRRLFCWRDLTLLVQIPFHGAQTTNMCPWMARGSARGWPGVVPVGCPGWDVEASSWSVYYIVVVFLDLPTKQKMNNSRLAEFFTSLCSFPIPCFQASFPMRVFISVCLFCKSNKYIDNCINMIHEK